MENKHQSYYMVIPSEVWDATISARAMVLYGHIMVLANKKKFCYATNTYFEKVMKSSGSSIKRAMKELEDNNLIIRENIYKEDSKEIEERRIFLTAGMVKNDPTPMVEYDPSPMVAGDPDNNTSNNKTSINKMDDVLGKMFFKLVDRYPANRIGNRQQNLKKFRKLTLEDAKLTLLNLERYLKASNGYHKSLANYITEECWSEAWLSEQESINKIKNKDIINTKQFENNYDNID